MFCDVINHEMSRDTKVVSHPIEQIKHYLLQLFFMEISYFISRKGRTSKSLLGACHLMMYIQALRLEKKLNRKIPTNSSHIPKVLASTKDFSKDNYVDFCPICLICLGIVSTKDVMKNEKNKALLFINGLGNVFSSKIRVFHLLISFDGCSYLLFQKFHP